MRKILILILLIFPSSIFAQTQPDPEIDKFVGTWSWTSGSDEVTITLQKQVLIYRHTGKTAEILVGWHSYTKNGVLIESSMQDIGADINTTETTSTGDLRITLVGFSKSPTKVRFSTFWDLTLNKDCKLELELLPGSTSQATWKLSEGGGLYVGPPGTSGLFTLPISITLTKQ